MWFIVFPDTSEVGATEDGVGLSILASTAHPLVQYHMPAFLTQEITLFNFSLCFSTKHWSIGGGNQQLDPVFRVSNLASHLFELFLAHLLMRKQTRVVLP